MIINLIIVCFNFGIKFNLTNKNFPTLRELTLTRFIKLECTNFAFIEGDIFTMKIDKYKRIHNSYLTYYIIDTFPGILKYRNID